LTPVTTPTSGLSSTSKADTDYYLSTVYVEQQLAALYNRPQSAAVQQWGRFEKAVTNSRSYDNPYEDVALEVKFTKPDGGTVSGWGFYDGDGADDSPLPGGVWRIRLMPDQTGTWHYEARFSDGSGQLNGVFLCVGSSPGVVSSVDLKAAGRQGSTPWPPGQISAYKNNPIWFGFKGGKAVLVRSLQVGDRFLADKGNSATGQLWSGAQREVFLDWARKQGYNMLCVPAHGTKGWNTPVLWDAKQQQPNCIEFRRLEAVLDELADRGMLACPAGGLLGLSSDFPKDEAKQAMYVRYMLARLGCYWNMLPNVGGPGGLQISDFGLRVQSRLQDEFAIINPQSAMLDLFEGPAVTDLPRLSRVALENRDEKKPLYAASALWAGSSEHPSYSPVELRKCAYVLLMSGATINFADLNGDLSSGFSGTLDLKQKVQARHDILKNAWDYFDRIPFWRLKPRPDLVNAGYCLADPGQRYLVYLDRRGAVTVNIDEGSYQVAWINARDTSDVRKAGIINSRRSLTSPQDQEDWLLSLVRVEIIGGAITER
jgi:hypothetical protein